MGREKAVSFWLNHYYELNFGLVLVEEDGSITYTANAGFVPAQGRRATQVDYPNPDA